MRNVQDFLPPLGRLLLSGLFILGGFSKLANPSGTAHFFASQGVPVPSLTVWVAIFIEFIGGIALLLGFKARWAAGVLAIWCLITGFAVHLVIALTAPDQMVVQDNMIHFYKNLAMAGGFLFVVAYGAGGLSIDNRLQGTSA
jgi:putative oxidoreductase